MYAHWLYYLLLLGFLLFGLFINLVGFPGLWLMVAAAAIYAWVTGGIYFGVWTVLTLAALALAGEVMEFFAGSIGAGLLGGSKRGMAGALAGGFIGGILLTFLIPIPILGTLIGVCAGSFIGTAAVELMIGRPMGQSMSIGYGAAKGRLYGTIAKSAIGLLMLIITIWMALPIAAGPPVLPPGP